jgi:CO/xanthine dehydrogenase FAD-binding subunit
MRTFEAILPGDVAECLDVLACYGSDAAILAGGTDLFVLMKMGMRTPSLVIYAGGLRELRRAERRDGRIVLGPAVTHSEVAGSELLAGLEVLRAAAASIGSPQVRNLGTVGGNIVNASPAGDLYPALLALDATVVLKSMNGDREVALEDFVMGPGETTIEPDEMLVAIRFDEPGGKDGSKGRGKVFTGFAKVGLRNALAISVANAALVARAEGGKLTGVRIAYIRASREYRCHVTGVVVSRLIRRARTELLEMDTNSDSPRDTDSPKDTGSPRDTGSPEDTGTHAD